MEREQQISKKLSQTFLENYKEELSELLDRSKGRTNKKLGSTPLGMITRRHSLRKDFSTQSNVGELLGGKPL